MSFGMPRARMSPPRKPPIERFFRWSALGPASPHYRRRPRVLYRPLTSAR
jgi:hypothetical protein